MIITEQTKAEAQRVLDYIERFPEVHDQKVWFGVKDDDENFNYPDIEDIKIEPEKNFCNTTMCIAGTQRWLAEGKYGLEEFTINEWGAVDKAGRALGLEYDEHSSLFYVMDNVYALDMLRALAAGDKEKFIAIRDEWSEVEDERKRAETQSLINGS